LRGVEKLRTDLIENGVNQDSIGDTGDEVADVVAVIKGRHGVLVCLVAQNDGSVFSYADGTGGVVFPGPFFTAADDGGTIKAGLRSDARLNRVFGSTNSGHAFSEAARLSAMLI